MLTYLSTSFWETVSGVVSSTPQKAADFTVLTVGSGVPIHTQYFTGGRLVAWHAGSPQGVVDLEVYRSVELDQGDLLGRTAADQVAEGTRFRQRGGPEFTVLGLPSSCRCPVDVSADFEIAVQVCCDATPFGPVEASISASASGIELIDWSASPSLPVIECSFDSWAEWVTAGGSTLDVTTPADWMSDIGTLSAFVGLPDVARSSAAVDINAGQPLRSYAAARSRPEMIDIMDYLDTIVAAGQ